jgi:ABC-2 type transport system ATP-binding protein
MKVLECKNLTKNFGKKEILKNVSLEINEGDILAFIGPNGAGKTTTIKLILGLQTIKSGEVIINGYDIQKDYVNAIKRVGAIVENPDSYMYLSGYDNLKLIANLYPDVSKERIDEVLDIVDLSKRKNDKVSKYSLGMRQRLGIAKALLANPNLLILDEPTNGLDPEGIRDLRNLLKKLADKGMGILISSHNLAELESFCNKVCVINSGVTLAIENVNSFKKDKDRYIFKVNDTKNIPKENVSNIAKESFVFEGNKKEVAKLVKQLVEKDIEIYEITPSVLTLEEAFLKKTGDK